MAYQSGDVIAAVHYNTFAQGGSSVDHDTANINSLWSTGYGNRGYGQASPVTPVGLETVTAEQWNILLARVNSVRKHQIGLSWTNIDSVAIGDIVTTVYGLSSAISTSWTNRFTAYANATDITTELPAVEWTTQATGQIVLTARWDSADQARYFFNAGGQIRIRLNPDYYLSNLRGVEWSTLLNGIGNIVFGSNYSQRTGTGGSVISQYSIGYWDATTSNRTLLFIGPALGGTGYGAGYGVGDTVEVKVRTNGVQGSNGDNGNLVTFTFDFTDVSSTGDDMNMGITPIMVARPPETTYLTTAIANPYVTMASSTFPYAPY